MVSVGEDGETKINQSSTFKVKMQHCFVPGTCTYFSSSSLKDKDFKKVSFCSGNWQTDVFRNMSKSDKSQDLDLWIKIFQLMRADETENAVYLMECQAGERTSRCINPGFASDFDHLMCSGTPTYI